MNVCVIDIGSNTIKASVFSVKKNREKSNVAYKGFKAKLISYIKDGILTDEGKTVLFSSIQDLMLFSESYACKHIFAFATASLRSAENSADILDELIHRFALHVDILTGEEEALCSLRGLLSDESIGSVAEGIMIDMGGGSTEIVHFKNGRQPKLISLDFGCLSIYGKFVSGSVPNPEEQAEIADFVNTELKKCRFAKNLQVPIYLIGGSGRAVLKIAKGKRKIKNLKSDGTDFDLVLEKFNDSEFAQNADNIVPGRAFTVCPAAIAYRTICEYIRPISITVSDSGVREGYLEKILP